MIMSPILGFGIYMNNAKVSEQAGCILSLRSYFHVTVFQRIKRVKRLNGY